MSRKVVIKVTFIISTIVDEGVEVAEVMETAEAVIDHSSAELMDSEMVTYSIEDSK
jgi:hypothetical protein